MEPPDQAALPGLVVYGPPVLPTAPPADPSNLTATAPDFNRVVLNWQDNSSNEAAFQVEAHAHAQHPRQLGGDRADQHQHQHLHRHQHAGRDDLLLPRPRQQHLQRRLVLRLFQRLHHHDAQGAPIGTGDGLLAQYWNDTTGHFVGTPALTRVDPQVSTDWGGGGPGGAIGVDHFSARWTGRVQAQFSQTYTFYTNADDGVRLYIKPIQSLTYTTLIDDFVDQSPTEEKRHVRDVGRTALRHQDGVLRERRRRGGAASPGRVPRRRKTSSPSRSSTPATPPPRRERSRALRHRARRSTCTGPTTRTSKPATSSSACPGAAFAVVATLPPDTNSYSDTALNPNTQYIWRVKATNFQADSAYTNTVTITTPIPPAKPTNAHPTGVTSTTIAAHVGRQLEQRGRLSPLAIVNGGSFIVINQLPPNTTTYTDTGLTPGGDYEYHIQSYNIAGYNDFSGFSTSTVPSAPSSPSATAGTQKVTLNWNAPAFNGEPTDLTYRVYRGTAAGGENATPIATGLTSPTYTDTGLTNGTTYYYKIMRRLLPGRCLPRWRRKCQVERSLRNARGHAARAAEPHRQRRLRPAVVRHTAHGRLRPECHR